MSQLGNMKNCKQLILVITCLFLSSCASYEHINLDEIRTTSFGGNQFKETLRTGYVGMAETAAKSSRREEEFRYGKKASSMLQGLDPEMEALYNRKISLTEINDLLGARYFLESAFVYDMKSRAPVPTAKAQLMFDCWVEEAERNNDMAKLNLCKEGFDKAREAIYPRIASMKQEASGAPMAGMQEQGGAPLAEVRQMPAPPIQQETEQPVMSRPSIVLFAFNDAALDYNASYAISNLATTIEQMQPTKIIITGNADDAGSPENNLQLSAKRGQAVADTLIKNFDVEAAIVDVRAYGENNPRAKPGEKNPDNRYVEVYLQSDKPKR